MTRLLPGLSLSFLAACGTGAAGRRAPAPLAKIELGAWTRPIATRSTEANRLFDRGLVLVYAFDHDEAIRSFEAAAAADPASPMPWWGIAFAHGPHINNPAMTPERSRAAWAAIEKARALSGNGIPVERALVDALARRYAADPSADRRPLDEAFASSMGDVWRANPGDADVGALYAESLMDLQPWDLWQRDGAPKGRTTEIVSVLEQVLELRSEHPLANHLYIHAMEASRTPEKALDAAERLRSLVPGAGHLVHMPGHIALRVGDYARAAEDNEKAIEADRKHAWRVPRAGFYRLYMAHNRHFLAFACMMQGRGEKAIATAREMVAGIPAEFVAGETAFIDGFMPFVLEVLVRFGRWEEVLREPEFPANLTVATATRRYARGTALAALGRLDEAEGEASLLDAAIGEVDDRPIGNNPARKVLEIPRRMLAGEIAVRRGRIDEGLAALREAAALEDELQYDEPPDWRMPVRHALGASLLVARRFEEAERVLREDLARFPENGWSLRGLATALRGRGLEEEAREVDARFARAWAAADTKISSPCLCQPGG